MIFADKLIKLRKRNGWSQEELAEKMNVSRQSVSKWEGAQSVPDLEKIVRLSSLFGVSTDYLLKDEIESAEYIDAAEEISALRRVSLEEASEFLEIKNTTAKSIAFATFICILSPICLFILGAMSEIPECALSDNMACGIGMIVLLVLVAIAVAIFISSGVKTSKFEYLEKEIIETEYGVNGMVSKRKEQYKSTYTKNNIIGVCMCILSLIPLFVGLIISENNDLLMIIMLSSTLFLAGIGVFFFIKCGIIWASFEKLLQEGDYTEQNKKNKSYISAISLAYWLIATAIYLAYSFTTNNWEYSWIVWVIAGVVYPAVKAIIKVFSKEK